MYVFMYACMYVYTPIPYLLCKIQCQRASQEFKLNCTIGRIFKIT